MDNNLCHDGQITDLGFGHLGNGVTVWDRTRKRYNDFATVAHIGADRQVKYSDLNDLPLTQNQMEHIAGVARNWDPAVSATQEQKVFTNRPN